jgi:proline iminopeptidase
VIDLPTRLIDPETGEVFLTLLGASYTVKMTSLLRTAIAAFISLSALAASAQQRSEEWFFKTADGKASIYVYEVGQGEKAIVLHGGFGSDMSYMLDVANGLESKHRFVFYDQRGSLRSPCNAEDVSFAKHVEDLELLRKEMRLEKVTIIAHSAGCLLACAYLQQHPEHVRRLVLAGVAQPKWRFTGADFPDGKLPFGDDYGQQIAAFHKRPEIAQEIKKQGLDRPNLTAREAADLWRITYTGFNVYHVDRWRETRGVNHFFNVGAARACKDLFSTEYDFMDALHGNRNVPITVIEGTHDACDFGGRMYISLFAKDPHVKVFVLKNASHLMWIDDRKGFRDALHQGLIR